MTKDYYNNQKQQRNAFKNYRKHMIKLVWSVAIGLLAAFALPWNILFKTLVKITSEYIAGSITVWAQVLLMAYCGLKSVYHTYKAAKEKENMDRLQGTEEDMIDQLINENDKLTQKVDNLEKEKEIVKVNTDNRSYSYSISESEDTLSNETVKQKVNVKKR